MIPLARFAPNSSERSNRETGLTGLNIRMFPLFSGVGGAVVYISFTAFLNHPFFPAKMERLHKPRMYAQSVSRKFLK